MTVHSIQFPPDSTQHPVHIIHYITYSTHQTMHTIQYIQDSTHQTVNTIQHTSNRTAGEMLSDPAETPSITSLWPPVLFYGSYPAVPVSNLDCCLIIFLAAAFRGSKPNRLCIVSINQSPSQESIFFLRGGTSNFSETGSYTLLLVWQLFI